MTENYETTEIIVTTRTLYGARRTISALKRAAPGAGIKRPGLRWVLVVEIEGNPLELSHMPV